MLDARLQRKRYAAKLLELYYSGKVGICYHESERLSAIKFTGASGVPISLGFSGADRHLVHLTTADQADKNELMP